MKRILTGVVALIATTFLILLGKAAADTWIEKFEFKCEVPADDIRVEDARAAGYSYTETGHVVPRDGTLGGIFYSEIKDFRSDCHDEIDRFVVKCRKNLLSLMPPFDPTSNSSVEKIDSPIDRRCFPILEQQRKECVKHFRRERAKCDAGSDDESREAQASDSPPDDEKSNREASQDGATAGDAWKPWENETASDNGEDGKHSQESSQRVNIGALNGVYEPDDGADNCNDVWADCPRDTYWTQEQQEGARQVELWVNYADPQTDEEKASPHAQKDTEDSRKDYERALAGLLNEGGPSADDLYPATDDDYRAVLEEMDTQTEAEERDRIAAEERDRIAAEKKRRSSTNTGSRSGDAEGAEDGICGSASACKNYIRHGEQVVSQVKQLTLGSMTDSFLSFAYVNRSTLGCLRKCLPYETSNDCRSVVQSAISKLENTYRSAIASAKGSAADSSYVDNFDRDPDNSQFVRNLGIRITGSSLDSCGD